MHRKWTLLAAIALAGTVCAGYDSSTQQKQMPAPAGDAMQDKVITPNAGPRVEGGWDFFITADFLYWTSRIDGLGYVMSGFDNRQANDPQQGKVYNPNWKWEPGFRVGLGMMLDHDGWDSLVEYTWLQSNAQNKTALGANFYPLWNIANQYTTPHHSSSHLGSSVLAASMGWNWWQQWVDWELGRNYFISQYLKLRPFIGVRGAWGLQQYQVQYTQELSSALDQGKDTMDNNWHYWGVGLRGGLDTAWHFSEEWSLYGDFAYSLLWSRFSVHRRDETRTFPFSNNAGNIVFEVDNTVNTCKPVLEFGLGLRWETWFSDDDYHIMLQAGWEEQIWMEYNQAIRLLEEGSQGDLTMQGLTIKARFDF